MVLAISAFESDPSFRAFQRTGKRSRSVNLLTHALFGWSKMRRKWGASVRRLACEERSMSPWSSQVLWSALLVPLTGALPSTGPKARRLTWQ